MRICPKCKTQNREGAKFCTNCGYEFGVIIRPPSRDPKPDDPIVIDPDHPLYGPVGWMPKKKK
jgi:predicted Zn-ribbon and HTH transcriptional regulator